MINSNDFNIPPLPESLMYCISYMYKDDFNYDTLVKKITLDMGITEKIFSIANSQYYSQGSVSINNLKQATIRIGASNILKILTNEYYKTAFKNVDIGFFNLKDFNRHSSYVSHLAAALGELAQVKDTNDLMIAGLFHDVGLVVRSYYQNNVMKNIVDKCKINKIDFYSIEKSETILTHDAVGKQVAIKWNFSKRISYLIEHHHTPELQRKKTIDFELHRELDILVLADILAHRVKFGFADYTRDTAVSNSFLDRLGLSKEEVARTARETLNAVSILNF